MAPKPKNSLADREDGPASTQAEEPVASSNGDGGNVNLAAKAGEASNQSHGPETRGGVHIKQEPAFGKPDNPLSAPTNMEKEVDTNSTMSSTTKPAAVSDPSQSATNIKAPTKATKKGPKGAKRKAESSSNEGPPTRNKPGEYRKPRKHALEAAKYVSHANSLVLSGKNAALPQDIDVDLPTICHAPTGVREHLKALEKAGLKLAHADPETIKTHVKVLTGLCHAFKHLKPSLTERDGDPRVDDFKWKLQGLNYPLHSHQMLGSAIMIVIERDENQSSGLLLDFMGFGKTVQTLACIVSNRVRSKTNAPRRTDGSATTLVVVPKSAATQWVEEVKRHTEDELSVMLWTKQTEISRGTTLAADILVVTYEQVRSVHKAYKNDSLLFNVCYHRIVLDEGHKIKNRDSETFKACMDLSGKHRWVLTGTPIPNGVHELWPLLKFIRHPSVRDSSFAHFKNNYLTKGRGTKLNGGMQYEDLSKILLPISIMRTPGHQFCGIPLVTLPQDHAIKAIVPLGSEEKAILEYLENHIMDYITMKCGGRSNYFCLMERFLRYRQFSATPLLLEGPVKHGLWTIDQIRLMKEEAHSTGAERTPIIDLFERWISEPQGGHLAPTGNRRLDSALAQADPVLCPLCHEPQETPMLAECGHIWCKACVKKWQEECNQKLCNKCKQLIGEVRPHNPGDASDDKHAMRNQKGVDKNGFQPADEDGSTLFQYLDQHPEASIPLSAKMQRMLHLILEWQNDAPDDKIIVFFRFIGIGRILGRLLQDHGIGYLYFVGQMNNDQRRRARVSFEKDPEAKVLMVSITTGSEALNLTMANRCIIYEPWWNGAVEEQAFGRVNRIGQQKETHCVRLFAQGTIDERMNDLQQEKKKQQSAIAELEAGKGLTAKTLRRILDGQIKKEGGSDDSDADTDSEDSGEDGEGDHSESEPEDPNDGDWVA